MLLWMDCYFLVGSVLECFRLRYDIILAYLGLTGGMVCSEVCSFSAFCTFPANIPTETWLRNCLGVSFMGGWGWGV